MSNYTKDNLLEVHRNAVPVGSLAIKVGSEVFPLTPGQSNGGGGDTSKFNLVKIKDYHPAREGFTAPSQIVVSGIGTIGDADWGTDGSAANGTYVITEDTKYKKGYSRVYKQQNGNYYLAGYDYSAEEWAEFGSNWYISTSIGGYGYSALLYYEGEDIPSGSAAWQSMEYGSATVTTAITNEEIEPLTETVTARSVRRFNGLTNEWEVALGADQVISGFSIPPQTNGIYVVEDGKLIGQHIDRELHIPEDGLVRRFKAVDGHFVDTVWGTEMKPSGDVSFDELGYCGNHAAPMVVTTNSYLSCPNTLTIPDNMTMNVFFRSFSVYGNALVFGFGGAWTGNGYITGFLNSGFGFGSNWAYGLVDGNTYGKWRMFTLTIKKNPIGGNDSNYTCRFYCNGKFISEHNFSPGEWYTNDIGVFSRAAIGGRSGEYISGQIDEACIWDRILTAEEIADMAKGVESFDWDIPVEPYVQEQPVFYAPLTEDLKSMTGQADTGAINFGTGNPLPYPPFLNGGMCNYNTDGGDSGYAWGYYRTCFSGVSPAFFTSGDFSIMSEVYPISAHRDWKNYDQIYQVTGSGDTGIRVKSLKGSNTLYTDFCDTSGQTLRGATVIPYNTWSTIIVVVEKGIVSIYVNGILDVKGTTSATTPLGDRDHVYTVDPCWIYRYAPEDQVAFKACQRNIRIYNRAITDGEIAELSGIKETE
jgi:hypothetical protein